MGNTNKKDKSDRMNREEAKQIAPVMAAWGNGAQVQTKLKGQDKWTDFAAFDYVQTFDTDGFANNKYEYRIKPTPTYRPWKPEEVPLGAQVKLKSFGCETRWLITAFWNNRVRLNGGNREEDTWSADLMLRDYEHSLDQGKTWLPCGVQEES